MIKHAKKTAGISPRQRSTRARVNESNGSECDRVGGSEQEHADLGLSKHQNGSVLDGYKMPNFFIFFSFRPFSLSLTLYLSPSLSRILQRTQKPASWPPCRPSPPLSTATSGGLQARKWHRSTDRNLLVPDLSFLCPKSVSKNTNLSFQIRFSKKTKIFCFSVFCFFLFVFLALCATGAALCFGEGLCFLSLRIAVS